MLHSYVCFSLLKESDRVRTGHGKPWKLWNFIIPFSRPGKAWNWSVGHEKSWKSNVLSENKKAKRSKVGKKSRSQKPGFNSRKINSSMHSMRHNVGNWLRTTALHRSWKTHKIMKSNGILIAQKIINLVASHVVKHTRNSSESADCRLLYY